MAQKKIFRDLSASTLQVVLNQLFGLLIFYLLSRYLTKDDFGEFNWSVAFTWVVATILSFGTDVLIVKRIAGGSDVGQTGGLHMAHTLLAGAFYIALLLGCRLYWPGFFATHHLLIGVAASALITFFSSPFKQIANGKEAFRNFAVMSVTANLSRGFLLSIAALLQIFTIKTVVNVYIISSLLEWLAGAYLVYARMGKILLPRLQKDQYRALLLEALPQLGVILFDSALARTDWILLGLIAGPAPTAEYSFAYKIYEASRLPMLVIAPIILPKFVRYFNNPDISQGKTSELTLLLKFETAIALLIPIFFNILWTPLMGLITEGKYGAVDAPIYLLLSICVPLQYYTNFLWTMAFAQQQLKLTFYITITVSFLNIALNLLLIPKYSSLGAAIAFVISSTIQFALYKLFVDQRKLSVPIGPLLLSFAIAGACTFCVKYVGLGPISGTFLSIGSYLLLIFITGILRAKDIQQLKLILKK